MAGFLHGLIPILALFLFSIDLDDLLIPRRIPHEPIEVLSVSAPELSDEPARDYDSPVHRNYPDQLVSH